MKRGLRNTIAASFLVISAMSMSLKAQTIAEKKAGVTEGKSELSTEMQKFLTEINKELKEKRECLKNLQEQVLELYQKGAEPDAYSQLLVQINGVKENIQILQESWREMATKPGNNAEGYALWYQPEATLEELVTDYGSLDYVYLIPPEVGRVEISVSSNLPIPQASWDEMLEQILIQNGVGIKVLNPYLRQLYFIQKDLSNISLVTANPEDLEVYPSNARVSFVLSPEPLDIQRVWFFLDKFVNPNTTVLQRIGRAILIVGEVSSIKDLLKIYRFVSANKRELIFKAIPLSKVGADEMTKVLSTVFEEMKEHVNTEQGGSTGAKASARDAGGNEINALNVVALPKVAQAVFLIGTVEEVRRAEEIIKEIEGQVGKARDRSIFWYNVKHSNPEDLAQILQKIYLMMIENRIDCQITKQEKKEVKELDELISKENRLNDQLQEQQRAALLSTVPPAPTFFSPPYYEQGEYVINPRPIGAAVPEQKPYNQGRDNFIIDPKTGALVMVVETELIPKLKEVLKRLDVPKKMVQIDVMLFERTMNRSNSYGLNVLKMGDAASGRNLSGSVFNGDATNSSLGNCLIPNFMTCIGKGIFEFFYSSKDVPMDFSYKFMMTQDNVSLNASPSVVTMNQTEATIAIKDEKSILVGTTFPVTNSSSSGVAAQNNYTRAQYGITITVTPTIHLADENEIFGDPTNYVSLVSHINFDTFPPGQIGSDQPLVNRREIVNEVRIPDGQTVIIGGLRQKQTDDSIERIPFLGEIPGIGKLFSYTSLNDSDTELIVFMTPKIIVDPAEDFCRLREEYLCKRPGDLPAFLCRLNDALEREKERAFQGYLTILFGRPKPRCICEEAEYDGRR